MPQRGKRRLQNEIHPRNPDDLLLSARPLSQFHPTHHARRVHCAASGAVRVMTLHAAKGLEFPVVFLCGVKEGSIPLESSKGKSDLQEERRLFFVGITRAREELILTVPGKPSVFLSDLPAAEILREKSAARPVQAEQLGAPGKWNSSACFEGSCGDPDIKTAVLPNTKRAQKQGFLRENMIKAPSKRLGF